MFVNLIFCENRMHSFFKKEFCRHGFLFLCMNVVSSSYAETSSAHVTVLPVVCLVPTGGLGYSDLSLILVICEHIDFIAVVLPAMVLSGCAVGRFNGEAGDNRT